MNVHAPRRLPAAPAASARFLAFGLFLAGLGAACGPKAPPASTQADTASSAPQNDLPTAPVPAAAPEPFVWLAWRQDAGGMAATALIVDERRGEPPTVLEVNRALFVWAADDVWSLSPQAERWPLSPCGTDSPGLARGLRYRPLGLAMDDDLPPSPREHRWSVAGARPGAGESATHEEVLVFQAQVGDFVVVRHLTRGDVCPVPAGPVEESVLAALDLRTGELASTLEVLPEAARRELAERFRSEAARRVVVERADLQVTAIAPKLRLEALDVRDTPAGRSVHLVFVGDDEIFAQVDDPSGMAPSSVEVRVPLELLSLELTAIAAPAPVRAFWADRVALDATRTEGVGDAALYGTVGWTELPSRHLPRVRAALVEIRDAPTPDGPTDWD